MLNHSAMLNYNPMDDYNLARRSHEGGVILSGAKDLTVSLSEVCGLVILHAC